MPSEQDFLLTDVEGQKQYEAVSIDRNPEKAPLPGTIPDVVFNMIPSKTSYGIQPSHVLCATFIGSIGVAFGLLPIFLTDDGKKPYDTDHLVPITGRVCCSFIILLISGAYIIWKYVTMQRSGAERHIIEILKKWWRNTKAFIFFVIFECPGLLQIFIFGIGSFVVSAVNLFIHLYKDEKNPVVLDINLTLYISWPCAIVCQMVMYSWFIYENHKGIHRRPLLHEYAIAAMIGTHVWLWVSDTTEPLWYDDTTKMTKIANDNETGKETSLESLVPFFEPFYVEYVTISIGLLYELWDTCTIAKKQASVTSNIEPIPWRATWWIRHLVIAITLAVIYYIGTTVGTLCASDKTAYDHIIFTTVMQIRSIQFVFLGVFLPSCTIYAIFQLSSTSRSVESSSSPSGNISGYILILTTIAELAYYIIRIVAAVIELYVVLKPVALSKNTTVVLYDQIEQQSIRSSINIHPSHDMTPGQAEAMDVTLLIYPLFMILLVLLQTHLLLEAQRRRSRDIPKAVKKCLLYIIAMNFVEWLQTGTFLSFSKHCPSLLHPVMNDIFHKDTARIITLYFYPLCALYRFHSAVIAWEVIIDDEEEGVGVVRRRRRNSF